MYGRFKRKSDKRKIAKALEVKAGIEEADFAVGDDLRSRPMQPVKSLGGQSACLLKSME
jgi:hypothetical protein